MKKSLQASLLLLVMSGMLMFSRSSASTDHSVSENSGEEIVTPIAIIGRILEQGDIILAKDLLDSLMKRTDLSSNERALATMFQASIALENQDTAEAVVWLHSWLDQFPHNPDVPYVNFLLGQCYLEIGAYDRARECFYRTMSTSVVKVSQSKNSVTNHSLMLSKMAKWAIAETEYQRSNWTRAQKLFERFKIQEPDTEVLVQGATYRVADCVYQMHQIDLAIEKYHDALALGPFHPFAAEAWLRLTQLYGLKEDYANEQKSLKSFIWFVKKLDPENADYWMKRCAKFLLSNWSTDVHGQINVLDRLDNLGEEDVESIRSYYLKLISRRTDSELVKNENTDDDEWMAWKKNFIKIEQGIETKIQELKDKKVKD